MSLPSQLVHVVLPKELLSLLDKQAKAQFYTRSEFIRQAVAEKLRPTTANSLPGKDGVNILMTDSQLEELRTALTFEHNRRSYARAERRQRQNQCQNQRQN